MMFQIQRMSHRLESEGRGPVCVEGKLRMSRVSLSFLLKVYFAISHHLERNVIRKN